MNPRRGNTARGSMIFAGAATTEVTSWPPRIRSERKATGRHVFVGPNVSPQVGPGFNRDYWAKLEQFVRDVAGNEKSRATYVATGPLFLPSRRESFDTATSSVATES